MFLVNLTSHTKCYLNFGGRLPTNELCFKYKPVLVLSPVRMEQKVWKKSGNAPIWNCPPPVSGAFFLCQESLEVCPPKEGVWNKKFPSANKFLCPMYRFTFKIFSFLVQVFKSHNNALHLVEVIFIEVYFARVYVCNNVTLRKVIFWYIHKVPV